MKFLKNKGRSVLVVSDTHMPFQIYGYLDFLNELKKEFKCDEVVHIGDFADNHAMSYHDADPDGLSAGDEYKDMRAEAKKFFKAFPKGRACIGNHDALPFRKAYTHGITKNAILAYRELFGAPDTWSWDFRFEIDNVQYLHGTGFSGKNAALTAAERHRQSTVIGHVHSYAGIQYSATQRDLVFGMNVGCLLDNEQYAFHYGKAFPNKPVVSAGVVIDGAYPFLIPMDLGKKIVPIDNQVVEVVGAHTIPKIGYAGMTKGELKQVLDSFGVSYRAKERHGILLRMVLESSERQKTKAKKNNKWNPFK